MDNLRHTIEILFRHRAPEDVREYGTMSKDVISCIDEKWFSSAFCHFFSKYSDDEVRNILHIADNMWMRPLKNDKNFRYKKNIFYIFAHFTSEVLCEKKGMPECRFEYTLRWHEMADFMGEDILTTSFLAYQDAVRGIENRRDFAWAWHIPNDCKPLQELCKRGLTDLHYHLYNSYPIFVLNWISLMNIVKDRTSAFNEMADSLCPQSFFDNNPRTISSIQALCLRAALIRYNLYNSIVGEEPASLFKRALLFDNEILSVFQYELQSCIDEVKLKNGVKFGKFIPDYAIPRKALCQGLIYEDNAASSLVYGERWLLYTMFKKIYSSKINLPDASLFYEYILIKSRLREELIQINNRIGFHNFKRYQDRKGLFIKGTPYENIIPYLSIHSSTANENVKYIEARVGLGTSYGRIRDTVKNLDCSYKKHMFIGDNVFESLLYRRECDNVFPHQYIVQLFKQDQYSIFSKGKDGKNGSEMFGELLCRNYKLRSILQKIAFAYKDLRISTSLEKDRVVGIDAVSSEYGCRPEVFGQVYRYLRNYSFPERNLFNGCPRLAPAGFTYHVGEDFLDLTDGLRAIDEALLFLELQNGDRIGHGLALGIDADEYYRIRQTVVLPAQDVLDNIVWMYFKCQELGIYMPSSVGRLFMTKYFELLNFIYPSFCRETAPQPIVYFQSMLLRGDAPSLYCMEGGEVKVSENFLHFWDKSGCSCYNPEIIAARNNFVARKLYYYYQYDWRAKQRGYESKEVELPKEYPAVISQIQAKMMREIAQKGIGIETNPSSNLKIAQLRRYDKHPIAKFFNLSLTLDANELQECPQISVSINTDDQGVFSTSVENEYALLAAAMIKKTDEEGKSCYSERMVFDWLERIRQLGWEQRFGS